MAMPPILVADLFPEVACRLVDLLRSLSAEEWRLPTVSSMCRSETLSVGSIKQLSPLLAKRAYPYLPPGKCPSSAHRNQSTFILPVFRSLSNDT